MNTQLFRLITKYQHAVHEAVILLSRSGIKMPLSCDNWLNTDIPAHGELLGGIRYFKHGYGCKVNLPSGTVDFDFGRSGEICGFDPWRLFNFAGSSLSEYQFADLDELRACFDLELSAGKIIFSGYILYYLSKVPRTIATEIETRLPSDLLPNRNLDPVLTLYAHYFKAADLMRKDFERLQEKSRKNGHLNDSDDQRMAVYLPTWLGFLAVTCEGFRKLRIRKLLQSERPAGFQELIEKTNALLKMINEHYDPLRRFRNNVFHLREDTQEIRNFFSSQADRFPWAGNVHDALADFFSNYHILCEVHYVLNGRMSESGLGSKRKKRSKVKSN